MDLQKEWVMNEGCIVADFYDGWDIQTKMQQIRWLLIHGYKMEAEKFYNRIKSEVEQLKVGA